MNPPKFHGFLLTVILTSMVAAAAVAAPLRDIPSQWTQPDGTVVNLLTSGDEFNRRTYDKDNFTVVRDFRTGWLMYADRIDGRLQPTLLAAGIDDPTSAGIRPGLAEIDRTFTGRAAMPRSARAGDVTPSTGVINNLFIFIRFSDDETLLEETAGYESRFNGLGDGEASMRAFFGEVSRGAVDVRTVFTPAPDGKWMTAWTSPRSRTYYQPWDATSNPNGYSGDSDAQVREHNLLRDALAAVEPQIPTDIDFDANDDGYFDNVIFMVQGWPDGWSDLLWPHMWGFYEEPECAGLKVGTYNLQLSILMLISPGTFAHEMYHSFGAPDLYHYSQDNLYPVGPWDLMESTGLEAAQHPLAYMKWKYGAWIDDIPLIEENQEVTLSSSWETGTQAVRVKVPESQDEYFVLEYRRKQGLFDSQLPMSGLLVYRIDPAMEGAGNRNGPPDEVYVFRPGGTDSENGKLKEAPLRADRRNVMNELTDPAPRLGDGTPVTFRVYDVGAVDDSITFRVCLTPPGCDGIACGTDGCGGWCGDCPGGNHCVQGACVPCTCTDRLCGDDGCGNSCGTCDDGDQCTADTCVDGTCQAEIADGTSCDDGQACTEDDVCDVAGTCAGTPYTCTPGLCVATSTCNGRGGCDRVLAEDGTLCDDGNPCTSGDTCDGKGGCGGVPFECVPGVCQESSTCDGAGGCVPAFMPIGTVCDDGDQATENDQCREAGVCRGDLPASGDVIGDSAHPDDAESPEIVENVQATGGCAQTAGGNGPLPMLILMALLGLLIEFRRRGDA